MPKTRCSNRLLQWTHAIVMFIFAYYPYIIYVWIRMITVQSLPAPGHFQVKFRLTHALVWEIGLLLILTRKKGQHESIRTTHTCMAFGGQICFNRFTIQLTCYSDICDMCYYFRHMIDPLGSHLRHVNSPENVYSYITSFNLPTIIRVPFISWQEYDYHCGFMWHYITA